jgi:PAS domain S-box-containing protein
VRAERALRASEDALLDLNETLEAQVAQRTRERDRIWRVSEDLLGVSNFDGYFTGVNPAWTATLGWTEDEIRRMHVNELRHPDDQAIGEAGRARLAEGVPTVRMENRFRHKDGSWRWISWTMSAENQLIYVIGRDVTAERESAEALRRAEDQLRQAQKMEAIGQLTGGIAHDFNNLLTGILGSLEMIRLRIAQARPAEVERYIEAGTTSAKRAAALTHRLLAFARRQPLDPRPLDVGRLVRSMEDLVRRTIGEAIRMELVASEDLWLTFCDRNQLETALLNLVINARDAMPNGGELRIATRNAPVDGALAPMLGLAPADYVNLSVTDTGAGMSPEVMARAFNPFFTTKPLGQGTGLGLSMVYGFAKQSNGHVRIDSAPDEGTRVELYLPRHRGGELDTDEAEGRPAGVDTAQGAGFRGNVLVVEDEPAVRDLVLDVLRELGCVAIEAKDGPSALGMLQSVEHIDLIITDVGLPGMNGRRLAEAARALRPQLKILFITGYAEDAAAASGFLEPGMAMVTKPFAIEALAERIKAMTTDRSRCK